MRFQAASVILLLSAAMQLPSQQPASNIEFNKQVQPIFTENCFGCHKGADLLRFSLPVVIWKIQFFHITLP